MNPKFILPVSFALAAHVFLLFGLPGRTPATILPPADKPLPPDENIPRVAVDEPRPPTGQGEDTEGEAGPGSPAAPRLQDYPPVGPVVPDFVVPVLPPVPPGEGITTISSGWERKPPGELGMRPPSAKELDFAPRARVQAAPIYPIDMRDRGIEGSVVVEFLVDEGGNAFRPAIVSSTRREFEDAALRAVARWKFEPGFRNGRRVTYRMSVPVVFRLERT